MRPLPLLLLALAIATPPGAHSLLVSEVLDVVDLAKNVIVAVSKTWSLVDEHFDVSEVPLPFVSKRERTVLNNFGKIGRQIERLHEDLDGQGSQLMANTLRALPEALRTEIRINDLLDYVTRIAVGHDRMNEYLRADKDTLERLTLEDFATTVVSHDAGSVSNLVERIHSFIVPAGKGISSTGVLIPLANSLMLISAMRILLLLGLAALTAARRNTQEGLLPADEFRNEFFRLQDRLWRRIENPQLDPYKEMQPEKGLIIELEKFGNALEKAFPHDITFGLGKLERSWAWARAYSDLRATYALYESFRRFQAQQTASGRVVSPKQAWLDLIDTILNDPKVSVPEASKRLNQIVVHERLFRDALKEINSDMLCNLNESPQRILMNLYNTVALTELKGYTMIQFSYMLLKLYNEGNFTKEIELTKQRYEERSRQALLAMAEATKMASRELWNCDPKKFVKDENYLEITELLQGYVQNEVDLNPEGTCRENCKEYQYTKSHGCYKNLYCRQQRRCFGKIINCQFIDSDAWVCPADPGSHRRYQYIEYENGRVLGRKDGGCSTSSGVTKVDSWWRWLFWHCSYCMCLCDQEGTNSDRYMNLRSSVSNVTKNMVVIGIKFAKKNRIIHLQVQQGQLLPRGLINATTVEWVPLDDYKITDRFVYNGQDFHTLTWEKRAMDLDDLIGASDELLTGVRFKMIGSHLNFEIRTTKFNFLTGKLDPERSMWKDNVNTDSASHKPRKKLNLERKDIPTRTQAPSVPDSRSDMYFEFTNTDLDKDVAQTTVPFIDAQPVESLVPSPLAGAGIHHKGRDQFGGFIAPKVFTYDFSTLLSNAIDNLPNSDAAGAN